MQPSPPDLNVTPTSLLVDPAGEQSAPGDGPQSCALKRLPHFLTWFYTIAGAIGLAAAFTLLVEKIELLADPTYVPSCSINPILSCGSVMQTDQAAAFGFPNPIIGIVGFGVIATVGVARLAGAEFRQWFWWGLQAGVTFAVVFVHWLIFESLYRIGALCPYCMVVWVVTIPLFFYTTIHNVRARWSEHAVSRTTVRAVTEYHGVVLTVWYLTIAALIAQRFWEYWSTLLT